MVLALPSRNSHLNSVIHYNTPAAKSLQLCMTLCDPMDCSPQDSSVHEDSPGKNTGVGCQPSSMGSAQPRDQTHVFYIARGFFTI